jgi:hypothetical protein
MGGKILLVIMAFYPSCERGRKLQVRQKSFNTRGSVVDPCYRIVTDESFIDCVMEWFSAVSRGYGYSIRLN